MDARKNERAPYEALVSAVLEWRSPALPPRDYQQIALQLTTHARTVAADILSCALRLERNSRRRAAVAALLYETERRLSQPVEGTAACAESRARLVRALYERLDLLVATHVCV